MENNVSILFERARALGIKVDGPVPNGEYVFVVGLTDFERLISATEKNESTTKEETTMQHPTLKAANLARALADEFFEHDQGYEPARIDDDEGQEEYDAVLLYVTNTIVPLIAEHYDLGIQFPERA